MIRVTLRGLRSRWRRGMLTGVAAVVGVAIVSGALMVSDTADRAGTGGADIGLVRQIMLIAGAVALLVGSFIVNVTTSVTVAQRTRELALLRCVGADTGQLRRSVLLESLLLGLAVTLAGLASGYGVAALLRELINTGPFPGTLPGGGFLVSPRTVVAALLVGCLATVLSTLGPARRAGRVSPVAALRDLPPATGGVRRRRLVWGALTLAAGVALVPVAVTTWQGPLLLPAAALTLVGVRLLGPVLAGRLAGAVGRPVAGALGVSGWLGRHNAARSPERTAATASALMIGLALLTLVNVVFASTLAPMLADYERDHADFQVWTAAENQARGRAQPMEPAVVARLRSLPELADVVTVDCVGDTAGGGGICAADPSSLSKVVDLAVVDVHLPDGGGRAVLDAVAANHPTIRFLALSVSDAAEDVIAVIRGGARGYVTKAISGPELCEAIRRVHAGDAYFSPRLAGFVLDAFGPNAAAYLNPELDQLTRREREVLRLVAAGYTYKEIGARLSISARTVETHTAAVLRKLQLSNRRELSRWVNHHRP